ncbi:MAG: bifunctional glutamate N-acetyltransferase/amino-acid acetyltransferase ArgJ [Candidatus Omnitrophica bacterium]|nr:bifunctional glutamate N-acetyltransferase/amino-acid acetyltransferase ArgJ [Candidatus Omnitrophota bacterium]
MSGQALSKFKLPKGFWAGGISAGLKKSGRKDLGLIFCPSGAKTAAFFTASTAQAAPLIVSKRHLNKNKGVTKAIIVNSGNANCFTGLRGIKDAETICTTLAKKLGVKTEEILIASTGIIGRRLPKDKIRTKLPLLINSLNKQGRGFPEAILTTDKVIKLSRRSLRVGKEIINIVGVAKGSGMIYPHLHYLHATMLGFIFTDCLIDKKALTFAAQKAVEDSFNSISVDGCMSTNDTVFFLASGKSVKIVRNQEYFKEFSRLLSEVCLDLAKAIVKDGEGATKLVEIVIKGASSRAEAKRGAFAIANSNLFKTAIYGQSPNWGRVVAALGQAGLDVRHLKASSTSLKKKEVRVRVNLGRGKAASRVFTSDLSPDYIKINAAYS